MLHYGGRVRYLNDRGLNVVTCAFDHISTLENLASLLLYLSQPIHILLNGLLCVKGSDESFATEGVPNL